MNQGIKHCRHIADGGVSLEKRQGGEKKKLGTRGGGNGAHQLAVKMRKFVPDAPVRMND